MAARDQSLFTRNYQSQVKSGTGLKGRFCDQFDETIDHIVSGCPILTSNEYKNRHDRVGQYLQWKICKHYNTPHAEKWYEHKTQPVVEGKNTTISWDFPVNTNRTIQASRPDLSSKITKAKHASLLT